ncbi:TPA: helix-turn-helix transcriptional regulator [Candidatus Woesearchaeota archaeon]|nr:helix-turn-helix transcriptional regulator [Candidatus Woesearchaeota archaeon]HIH39162.1 helix-turn-helix transcriptional regulator [Candidatus Woesearchaeota archaeon]
MGRPRNNLEGRIGIEYVIPKQAEAHFQHQVGQVIREYRLRNDFTQQEAADRYGCTLRYWQFLEQGQNISLKAILKLAKVLDVKPSKLLE